MKRIIWHWTAGAHTPNASDKRHYHYIIDGAGNIHSGNQLPEANLVISEPMNGSTYAAHTRGLNTGSIGVAVAAMRGAVERPFREGDSPITEAQVAALVAHTATLCRRYGISVTRETVMSHAEVQRTLGVAQRGKWDITWLPGIGQGDAVALGDILRERVRAALADQPLASKPVDVSEPAQSDRQSILARLVAALAGLAAFVSNLLKKG